MDWIEKAGNWTTVKPDLERVISHYKEKGATSFGIFGFCWGGKMAMKAGAEIGEIKGAGIVHGSFIDESDAENIQCPVIFLPSKNEADQVIAVRLKLVTLYTKILFNLLL